MKVFEPGNNETGSILKKLETVEIMFPSTGAV